MGAGWRHVSWGHPEGRGEIDSLGDDLNVGHPLDDDIALVLVHVLVMGLRNGSGGQERSEKDGSGLHFCDGSMETW